MKRGVGCRDRAPPADCKLSSSERGRITGLKVHDVQAPSNTDLHSRQVCIAFADYQNKAHPIQVAVSFELSGDEQNSGAGDVSAEVQVSVDISDPGAVRCVGWRVGSEIRGVSSGPRLISLIDGVGRGRHHVVGKVPKVVRVQQLELIAAGGGNVTHGGHGRAGPYDVVVLVRVEGAHHLGCRIISVARRGVNGPNAVGIGAPIDGERVSVKHVRLGRRNRVALKDDRRIEVKSSTLPESGLINYHRVGANRPSTGLPDSLSHTGGTYDDDPVAIRKGKAIAVVVVGYFHKVSGSGDRAGAVRIRRCQCNPESRDQDGTGGGSDLSGIEEAVVGQTTDGTGRIDDVQRARRGPAHPVAKSILPGDIGGRGIGGSGNSIRSAQEVVVLQSSHQLARVIEACPGRHVSLDPAFVIVADADLGCCAKAEVQSEKRKYGQRDDHDEKSKTLLPREVRSTFR